MSDQCQVCGSKCCRYFCFEIDEPDDFDEFEDIRWYLCHEDVSVHVDEGDWYISIQNPCKMLDDNGGCSIYETRPKICRGYTLDNCDHTGGDYGYDAEFHTPEQLEDYARKTLGVEEYDREQAKLFGRKRKPKAPRRKARR